MQYFNRNDRQHHLCLLVTWDYLDSWIEREKCLLPTERKWTKLVITYLKKISDSIVERSDKSYVTSLTNEVNHSSIIIEDNRKKVYKEECIEVKTVIEDDLNELFDYAISACSSCTNKDFKTCKRFNLFMKMSVPPLCEDTTDCPYRG